MILTKKHFLAMVAIVAIAALAACAQPFQSGKTAANEVEATETTEQVAEDLPVDCEQLMTDIATDCYEQSSIDENGEPLSEGELLWIADYCECFAHLSFQTYGCSGVVEHQQISEEEFQSAYSDIFNQCEIQQNQLIEDQYDEVEDVTDAVLEGDEASGDAADVADATDDIPEVEEVEVVDAPAAE